MQHHQRRRHLVNLWTLVTVSLQNCKCDKWLLDQGVVIWGYFCGNRRHSNTFRPSNPHDARLICDSEIEACSTRNLEPLNIVSQAKYHIVIGFWRRHGDSSCVAGRMNSQTGISDNVSFCNVIPVPTFPRVSIYLISVTKLWDMIIRLCMCKGRISHAKALDFISHWLTTNEHDIVLPITGKSDNSIKIRDETDYHNVCQWCHTSHRCSGHRVMRSWMKDNGHSAYDHASNCITLCADLVHMVKMLKITHGRSCK